MTEHFIVCERDAAWLHTCRGHTVGPFKTREEAVKAAIAAAQETGDEAVEVLVQNHDLTQETICQSGAG